jgi:uncharacterized protein involved in outer membrane biogenesis
MAVQRRTGLILAGIAGALLMVSVFMLPALLDADRYRPRVIAYLEESTGKPVEISRLAVTFFPKLAIRVENFGVKNPPPFPPGYVLKVARIDAQLDPWALLHRQILISSLVLERPLINLVSDPDGPWNFETPAAKTNAHPFALGAISRVKIRGGSVFVSNLLLSDAPGPAFFEAHEVTSELANVNPDADPAAAPLDGQGTLKAAALRFASIEAKRLSSNIRLQSKRVSFTDVKAETYGGNTRGELAILLSGKNTSFSTDARMKRIDVAQLLSAFPNARGKMTGKMEGELQIAGSIGHSLHPLEALHGSGHVTVRDGQVPSLKLNANLMKLARFNDLGPARDDPSSFKLISTDLELDHERLSSKAIDIDGYGVDVDGAGSVRLSGPGELDLHGVAVIVSRQGFVTRLFARLAGGTLKEGKLAFPFHIGGTIDNPIFSRSE